MFVLISCSFFNEINLLRFDTMHTSTPTILSNSMYKDTYKIT